MVLAVQDRPLLLRTFMPDAGSRAVAVGFPKGVSVAFDAQAGRVSLTRLVRRRVCCDSAEEDRKQPALAVRRIRVGITDVAQDDDRGAVREHELSFCESGRMTGR